MHFEDLDSLLPDGTLGKLNLQNCLGSNIFILFYPGDFLPVSREEIRELKELYQQFKTLRCHVFACGATTSQMHQAWMSTKPTEDHEGLGFRPPFSMIGDPKGSFCKKFDMYNEGKSSAKHGFVLLNESGHVKYKEIVDPEKKLDLSFALATVQRSILFKEIKDKVSSIKRPKASEDGTPPPIPENPPPEDSDDEEEKSGKKDAAMPFIEEKEEDTDSIHSKRSDSKSDDIKHDNKSDDIKHDDNKSDDIKHDDNKSDQVKHDDTKSDEIKHDDTKSDEIEHDESEHDKIKTVDDEPDKVDDEVVPEPLAVVVEINEEKKDTAITEEPKAASNEEVDSAKKSSGGRQSVQDMEANLKRELTAKRKENAPQPPTAQKATTPGQPAPKPSQAQGKKKPKDESCCVIA